MKKNEVSQKQKLKAMACLVGSMSGVALLFSMYASQLKNCRSELVTAFQQAANSESMKVASVELSPECRVQQKFYNDNVHRVVSGELKLNSRILPLLFLTCLISALTSF